jgi:hypothetical protein
MIRVVKSKRLRQTGSVSHMELMGNAPEILVGKSIKLEDRLEDLVIDGRLILKLISKK